ncbi:MAG: recombination protein RecR [Paludibacteraceae bacterium]|nr:recombination protein RecR [Paludibacteraceae bacterium]MBO5012701.1 recombination protein RecR [Paludibacteraceae bacterium]MBP3575926.1 recombination protein RecR [Paludibacteraceae bacterium]
MTNYPSILLSKAVDQFASLPGIGRKTALRLVLHLLRQSDHDVEAFTAALNSLKKDVHYCRICHTVSDQEVCPICQSHKRDKHLVCVVENVQDVMSIENTGQYHGLYHVLGGVISPMDGIGPSDLEIDSLVARIEPEEIQEVILALPTTMEGDTTNFYIYRRLQNAYSQSPIANNQGLKISQIARGVAIGNELEYTDEITLGRSIINRIEFKG